MARKSKDTTVPSGLIDIEITGDTRDVEMRLIGMEKAFEDFELADWLTAKVDPILRARTAARFESEGDAISGKWQSLAPWTVKERERTNFPGEHPINVRTGEMRRHLLGTFPRTSFHSLGVTMWSPGTDGGSTTAKKVKIAQQGGETPEGHPVPARPVLGVGPEDLELVLVTLGHHIASFQPGGANVNGMFS